MNKSHPKGKIRVQFESNPRQPGGASITVPIKRPSSTARSSCREWSCVAKLGPLLIALLLGSLASSDAHSVWIETSSADQLVLRFAQPGEEFEQSPGYLDHLTPPIAFAFVTNAAVAIQATKKQDHFLLTPAPSSAVACVETAFTVRGGRKPYFYARWQPSESSKQEPLLTLDLVPQGKGAVRVFFRGKPLGKVTATLRTPDGKEQELIADDEGFLRFSPEQSGLHLLTVAHHREDIPGFHLGKAYQQTSHNAALTWMN